MNDYAFGQMKIRLVVIRAKRHFARRKFSQIFRGVNDCNIVGCLIFENSQFRGPVFSN
jgi:hypothetical protein